MDAVIIVHFIKGSQARVPFQVESIAAFTDNYIWLISRHDSTLAWVVDPGDALPVLQQLANRRLQLEGVLLTHHHPDHDGGIPTLMKHFPGLRIISGQHSQSPHANEYYPDGAQVNVLGQAFELIDVPGHTLDHVAFYCPDEAILFSGDTLFACGCGRLFEGTAAQMHHSLSRIAALPGNSLNYCAHEYTLSNIRFALAIEPDNTDLQQRAIDAEAQRALGIPTIPSLLSLELATNPFLRCHEPSIMAAAHKWSTMAGHQTEIKPGSTVDVFTALRSWKDHSR